MTTPRKGGPPVPEFEVPDLELEAPPARQAPARRERASGALELEAPRRDDGGLPGHGLELEPGQGPALELETDATPGSHARGPAQLGASLGSFSDDFGFDDDLALEPVAPPLDTAPWPRGRSSEGLARVDSRDVEAYADFGPSNLPFYLAPLYTWRVFNRRRWLERDLDAMQRELQTREVERDELLVDLTESVRPLLMNDERFRVLIDELSGATTELEAQEQALATTNAGLSRELEAHDRELERLDRELAEQSAVVQTFEAARDQASTDHKRAQAKLRRAQIEVRNATARGRAVVGPEGGTLPPDLAAELSRLHQAADDLSREAAPFQQALVRAEQALRAKQEPVTATLRAMEAVRAERRAAVARTQKQLDSESTALGNAKRRHTEIGRRIAQAVLDLKGSVPVERALLERVQASDDAVDQAARQVELRRQALESANRETFNLGIKVVLVPPLVLLVVFLVKLAF